jgi:hypothetical protein
MPEISEERAVVLDVQTHVRSEAEGKGEHLQQAKEDGWGDNASLPAQSLRLCMIANLKQTRKTFLVVFQRSSNKLCWIVIRKVQFRYPLTVGGTFPCWVLVIAIHCTVANSWAYQSAYNPGQ